MQRVLSLRKLYVLYLYLYLSFPMNISKLKSILFNQSMQSYLFNPYSEKVGADEENCEKKAKGCCQEDHMYG